MTGYAKQRSNWLDFPTTSTPILAANLNAFETALFELKTSNVKYASDYGAATAAAAATNSTAINAAISDMSAAGGGTVLVGPGTYAITTLTFAGFSNVRLIGTGQGTTLSTATTTGNIFDFTNASFCSVESMQIMSSAARTAGAIFFLDVGAGSCQRNEFRRLRIAGGWRAFNLSTCTTTTIDEVSFTDVNAAHSWDSMISLTGTATSTMISNLRGGSAATVTNGFLYASAAGVDTLQCHNFDVLNLAPSTGMIGVNITNGEWFRFTDCSFEAGTTADAFVVAGGQGIDLIGCHLIGKRGLISSGGKAVRMIGGEIVGCYNGGIAITGGTHYKIMGVTISDNSVQTNNTYDGINVSPNVTDFEIIGNTFGDMLLSGNDMATAVTVQSGTSDRYIIKDNRVGSTGVLTPLSDNGTGVDKIVADNVWVGSGYASVTAATTCSLPVNASVINVTGNTNITTFPTTPAGYKGRRVSLVFTGTPTVTDGSNLKLAGNFVAAGTTNDADVLEMVCDGTNWIETSRSVN